ncbi:hypothetical protein [Salinisphaera sp.]|uniref:hypothetical protein n=1 Tax=Salinisphaera sp. TaxID=1914330 RepID=UPI000C6A206D|nr:hypothetical protein [Salinisphaera sp.]MBS61521.1 hypothetical protein [Salinisphaera sp.]
MSEDDLIEANPCKLRNGDWGCKTQQPVQVGDTVQIVTRANKQWRAEVTQVVWTDGQVCICATASDKQKADTSDDASKAPASKAAPKSRPARPAAKTPTANEADENAPPAPPRFDVPPTDELDAMADSAAEQGDADDELFNALNEFERDPG